MKLIKAKLDALEEKYMHGTASPATAIQIKHEIRTILLEAEATGDICVDCNLMDFDVSVGGKNNTIININGNNGYTKNIFELIKGR